MTDAIAELLERPLVGRRQDDVVANRQVRPGFEALREADKAGRRQSPARSHQIVSSDLGVEDIALWTAGVAVDRALATRSLLLMAELVADEGIARGAEVEWQAGTGVRWQAAPRWALDAGLAYRFTDDTEWSLTFGTAYSFGIPGRGRTRTNHRARLAAVPPAPTAARDHIDIGPRRPQPDPAAPPRRPRRARSRFPAFGRRMEA